MIFDTRRENLMDGPRVCQRACAFRLDLDDVGTRWCRRGAADGYYASFTAEPTGDESRDAASSLSVMVKTDALGISELRRSIRAVGEGG